MGCGVGKEQQSIRGLAIQNDRSGVAAPVVVAPSVPDVKSNVVKERQSLSSRDGKAFPVVVFTSGTLHVTAAEGIREASLSIRCSAGDKALQPTDDEVKALENGFFQIPAKKQKLVSYFALDDNASQLSRTAALKLYRETCAACTFTSRMWRSDSLSLNLCLTIMDSVGHRVEYEAELNLLDGKQEELSLTEEQASKPAAGGPAENEADTDDSQAIARQQHQQQQFITAQFRSVFSTKNIASFEFSFRILFRTLSDGAAHLRIAASSLESQHPLIFDVVSDILRAVETKTVGQTDDVLEAAEKDVEDLLDVLQVLTSDSKISFLKNKLKGQELSDKYRTICKQLCFGVGGLLPSDPMVERIDQSAASIVDVSSSFFDNIMAAKDGAAGVKEDVSAFMFRYRASLGETASAGADAGGSFSQLAALLCDVQGLVEPLIRAAPFGMLVVEAIGVVFKLIVGRSDMLELCGRIASRLAIFLRVLQQPEVQDLLKGDAATLEACVGVYIAIDDCSECMRRFQNRNIAVQLFSATSQLKALQHCYNELHEQFDILHNVTSLRAMATAKVHQASMEDRLKQLIVAQQFTLLSCDLNANVLSKILASVDSMQSQLLQAHPEEDTDALVCGSVKQAIRDASSAEMASHWKDVAHRTGGGTSSKSGSATSGGDDLHCAMVEGLSAVAASSQTSVSELSDFASATVRMWKSGPHLPAALAAQSQEAIAQVIQTTGSGIMVEMKYALQASVVQQLAQHKKTRAEVRSTLKKIQEEFRSAQATNVSIGKKLDAAINGVASELREVRKELQRLATTVVHPLKQIEAHILQYTNFHAMNKPVEVSEVDLVLGEVVYAGERSEVRRGSFQNRDVVVKKYRSSVEPSVRREEAMTLFQIHHNHIVELIATVADRSLRGIPSQLVLERLGGGPLRDLLARASQQLTREQRLLFTYDIVGGVNFLHSQSPPRLHCHIDLSNVLATTDVRGVKLIDFKFSQASSSSLLQLGNRDKQLCAVDTTKLPTGTAPELVVADDDVTVASSASYAHTISSDTYAVGIALYELWTGNIAFRGKSGKLLLKALKDGDEPFSTADLQQLPSVIQALLTGLTDVNIVRRLSLSQVLRLQQTFGQSLLEAPEMAWLDYFPFWNKKRSSDGDLTTNLTLCTENIPKFTKLHLRKYLIEKEITSDIVEHIEKKGYTAKQYLRMDFLYKAFPPEDRSRFDVLHLDSFVELQEFDAEYHQQPRIVRETAAALLAEQECESSDNGGGVRLGRLHSGTSSVSPQAHRSHFDVVNAAAPPQAPRTHAIAAMQRRAFHATTCVVRINSMISASKKNAEVEFQGWMDASSAANKDTALGTSATGGNFSFGDFSDESGITAISEFDRFFNLGSCEPMEVDGFVIENGAVLTKKECYRRALEATDGGKLASTRSAAWVALGASLTASSEMVQVGEASYTRKDCFARAVALDGTSTDAWATLTAILAANETVAVGGKEYNRRNCAEQALLCSPKDPGLWVLLASCLAAGELAAVEVGGDDQTKHSKRSCLVKALTISPSTARYWYLLSQTLKESDSVDVGARKGVNKLTALIQYVSCDTTSGHAWLNLGLRLDKPAQQTATVHGKEYTRKLCFVEAANCGASEAYNYLGFEMNRSESYTIAGDAVDTVVAYCRGLEQDDSSFSLWNNLGVEMIYRKMYPPHTVDVGARKLTMTDVFLGAVERDPLFGKAWNGLGISLGDHQSITVLQRVYTKQQCYLKSLALLPSYMYAWNWLGMTLAQPDDSVVVNGSSVTKRNCFQKAIELGWDYAYPWWNLMMSMNDGDSAILRGSSMPYRDIVKRAHQLYPSDKDVLERLAALSS